jgi:ABC-type glycerol-3-phosphate transport system substrate-binding protein
MPSLRILALAALTSIAAAQSSTTTSAASESTDGPVLLPAEVTNCHTHGGETVYCFDDGDEWAITSDNAAEFEGEASLTDCEPHGEGGDVM